MYCCQNIRISDDDGLPTLICDICKKELESSYNFVLKCEASDKKLRFSKDTIFNSLYSIKEEIKKECEDKCGNSFDDDTPECPLDNVKDDETTPSETGNLNYIEKKTKSNSICEELEYQCSVCGRFCASNSILITHMRTHTNDKSYHCQFCDKKYKEKRSLKRHIDSCHHPKNRSRNFICESCGKAFFSKNDVKIHLRTHTGWPCVTLDVAS
ncbi:unnamed protein product [Parnassius apollo]|uniref:(apollo) hypothetical protein n=1 Tax=Parnassius apollo TaxID=110799 RepID=A0A8S3VYT5_PARAO|nr:unnamed protein product [Parnassius apollo]